MMTWLVKNRLAAFEKRWGYDVSYMRDLLAADSRAFWAFARVAKISEYRRDVPVEPWFAAKLVGAMHEDCGPCTQLVVGMALAARCTQTVNGNVIAGDDVALPDDVRLAVEFARAVLVTAAATGDVAGLASPLAEDAVLYTDGGGKRRAALNPIYGRDKIARFFIGVRDKNPPPTNLTPARINGLPGFVFYIDGEPETIAFEIRDGAIAEIYGVRNPDKLRHITPA